MNLKRSVMFIPAYDKRDPEPSKNYGVGAVRIRFVLAGDKGAVQWVISTGWYLPGVDTSDWRRPPCLEAFDLGYHSTVPRHADQSAFDCDLLPGGECYYDGSSLNAARLVPLFLQGGDDAVWKELEDYYRHLFGDEEQPA